MKSKRISFVDLIKLKLERAESSGFTDDSKSEILALSKKLLNGEISIER